MATTKITLRDAFGLPFELEVEEGPDGALRPIQNVQVSGSNGELELQGPIAAIPAADSVPQNSTYFALDEGELYWTNGSEWKPVGA